MQTPLLPQTTALLPGLRLVLADVSGKGAAVPASRYATAILARFDAPTGRLRFVNAGNQTALIVRADGTA